MLNIRRSLRHTIVMLLTGLFFPVASAIAAPKAPRPWTVHQVQIVGNKTFSRSILLDRMITRPAWLFSRVPYSAEVLDDDIEMVQSFYRNEGFLESTADLEGITIDSLRRRVDIVIKVTENQRTVLATVRMQGNSLLSDSLLLQSIKSKAGAAFISSQVAEDNRILLALYTDRGWLDAVIEPSIALDTATHRVALLFTIKQAEMVRSGPITITGLKAVKEAVIRRELKFQPGDTLTTRHINSSVSGLYRTDLFQSVSIAPQGVALSGQVDSTKVQSKERPVVVSVVESDMFQVEAGGGYGTSDAIRLSTGVSYRNLFGMGKRLKLDGKLSSRVQGAEVGYADSRPWGIPLSLDITGYYGHHNQYNKSVFNPFKRPTTYLYHANIGGVRASIGMTTPLHIAYFLAFRWEDVRYLAPIVTDSLNARRTQSVALTLTYDTRDDVLNPHKGIYSSISTEVAGLGRTGTNQFVKSSFDGRYFLPLSKSMVFATGIQAGIVQPYGASIEVPVQERFRAGGSGSIRGFQTNSIGPTLNQDSTTTSVGGGLLLVLHPAEIRFPLYKILGGVVFVDGGDVWTDQRAFSYSSLNWSVGTGLRVHLPLGIIRLDGGLVLKADGDYPKEAFGALHLDIGEAF